MKIAAIIPSYRVSREVLGVIERIGPEVSGIFDVLLTPRDPISPSLEP